MGALRKIMAKVPRIKFVKRSSVYNQIIETWKSGLASAEGEYLLEAHYMLNRCEYKFSCVINDIRICSDFRGLNIFGKQGNSNSFQFPVPTAILRAVSEEEKSLRVSLQNGAVWIRKR